MTDQAKRSRELVAWLLKSEAVPPDVRRQVRERLRKRVRQSVLFWMAAAIGVGVIVFLASIIVGLIGGSVGGGRYLARQAGGEWIAVVVVNVAMATVFAIIFYRGARESAIDELIVSDPDTGRLRRCAACDYDLRASPGDTCPECGAAVRCGK